MLAKSYLSCRGAYEEQNDPFDANENPTGIINAGLAENMLSEAELTRKLSSLQAWCPSLNHYGDPLGDLSFRQMLCQFFHKQLHLNNNIELNPDQMIVTGGAASTFVIYSYMLTDSNDAILIPSPYYSYLDHNLSVLTENQVVRCPLLNQETGLFELSRQCFEYAYAQALKTGLNPRMILLINPNNPLGDVYDETILLPILEFAAEKCLHVVIDEIYAFSTFTTCSFQSILNYQYILPDPDRTHFLWSFSKDFCLNGVRVGVMYTGTKELCQMSSKINFLFVPSRNTQYLLQQLISDHQWIDDYIQTNRKKLTERYTKVKLALEMIQGVRVRRSRAEFFLWIDLREFLCDHATFDDELRLFEHLFECAGVFLLRGQTLGCSQPGWFRFVFSLNDAIICEAIKRIQTALIEQRDCLHFST